MLAQSWAAPLALFEAPTSFLVPVAIAEVSEEVAESECSEFQAAPSAETISSLEARCALASARQLHAEGETEAALAYLDGLIAALPDIADRLQVMRGEWTLASGDAESARDAFRIAATSIDSTTKLLGRVGEIRALAHLNPALATRNLNTLVRSFPRLPQRRGIELSVAERYEAMGQMRQAIAAYRRLDLDAPGCSAAATAREHLERLRAAGQAVGGYSAGQQISRAEHWLRSGPFSEARIAVQEIEDSGVRLSSDQRARVALMKARLARIEGRFADASRLLSAGQSSSTLDAEESERVRNRARDMQEAGENPNANRGRALIRRVQRGRAYLALRPPQLLRILEIAVQHRLSDEANRVLSVLPNKQVSGGSLFQAAIRAIGVADQARVMTVIERLAEAGRLDARYHRARFMAEQGQRDQATREFRSIIAEDRSAERYYGMWAGIQLNRLGSDESAATAEASPSEEARLASPTAENTPTDQAVGATLPSSEEPPAVVESQVTDANIEPAPEPVATLGEGRQEEFNDEDLPAPRDLDGESLARLLEPLIAEHGDAYPWMTRAKILLELEEFAPAADEIAECLIAWREARGRSLRRMGLEAVARGTERSRQRLARDLRLERRALESEDRAVLAQISRALGESGTYVALTGWHAADERPRAHADIVERAARTYGVDPNLIFAVMRVESVFQARIVSYAGAVGLMQIMPRTGENIADALEQAEFTTADLLDPETNIHFAAWYLASLIDRFDGRLPLAIASYNGGPHNVRRWMQDHSPNMPLDAFLERIPFTQTHRYVRRVLTHYQAYRAQVGLPMIALSTELPERRTDLVAF